MRPPDYALRILVPLSLAACASQPVENPATGADTTLASDDAAPTETPVEPSPPPRGVWTPPQLDPSPQGELVWAQVQLRSACTDPDPPGNNSSPIAIIASEADFEAAYCRRSTVDWTRIRLAVIPYEDHLTDIRLVADESVLRVLVETRSSCDAEWGQHLHLLLPAGSAPLVVTRKRRPPHGCPEGYGY